MRHEREPYGLHVPGAMQWTWPAENPIGTRASFQSWATQKVRVGGEERGINTSMSLISPMHGRSYHVSLKRQRGEGFVARCMELPGCLSEGETEADALRNIQDAIKLYLEDV